MVRLLTLFITLQLTSLGLLAQGPNSNWVLGDSLLFRDTPLGLVFEREVPLRADEALSSFSKSNGELLYYSNGVDLLNRLDLPVLGSESLFTVGTPGFGSTVSQGVVFVPMPGDSSNRFCYIIQYAYDGDTTFGWAYSLLDATLDFGLGGIVDSVKNIFFSIDASELLHTIRHVNGNDWWIFTTPISADSAGIVRRHRLDQAGLDQITSVNLGTNVPIEIGELTSSRDGCSLAKVGTVLQDGVWNSSISILDIDRSSGDLSLRLHKTLPDYLLYSATFSSKADYLYVTKSYPLPDQILQIPLNSDSISLLPVFEVVNGAFYNLGEIERGQSGRIYFPLQAFGPAVLDTLDDYLGAILFPDSLGDACAVTPTHIYLGKSNKSVDLSDFPNYVNDPVGCDTTSNPPDTTTGLSLQTNKPLTSVVNPTVSNGQFWTSPYLSEEETISVYNQTGALVLVNRILSNQLLDLSTLPPGCYYVKLNDKLQGTGQKIFIIK